MAAPEYVPTDPTDDPRLVWKSPPRRPDPWEADRPGDFPRDAQPRGARLGSPGPDQGYIYTLLPRFRSKLKLVPGEDLHDVEAGCVHVAMKRSSIFGRAPVAHDLTVAFTVWGFFDDPAPDGLVKLRKTLFEGVGHPNTYVEKRAIADAVPESTLRKAPAAVSAAHAADWKALLDLDSAKPAGH